MQESDRLAELKADSSFRSYVAQSRSPEGRPSQAVKSAGTYRIEVRFLGGLSAVQEQAFQAAADRWAHVIVEHLPPVVVDGEEIDDVLILAQGTDIDEAQGVLGQAGPTALRPPEAGRHAFLPAKGEMIFDTADLAQLESDGSLVDVIAHEMGHVLGFGTIWARKKLLVGASSGNPTFNGRQAREEYGRLRGAAPKAVPVENIGGVGTRNSHWRESVFATELMSGYLSAANNPMSALTVASLADLGYTVDMSRAESFELPDLVAVAEAGLVSRGILAHRIVLPRIPIVLPKQALV